MLQWIAALILFVLSFALEACSPAGAIQSQEHSPAASAETPVPSSVPAPGSSSDSRTATASKAPEEALDQSPKNSFCRIEPVSTSEWKVYSEGQRRPLVITSKGLKKEIEPRVSQALKRAGVKDTAAAYQLYLRCSQAAPELVFDFDQGESKACVVYRPQTKTAAVFSNNEASETSPCTGETPQTLLIGLQDPNLLSEASQILRSHHPDVLEDLRADQGIQVLLKLREEYRFRENDAKKRLEADSDLMSRVDFLDYERVDGLLGESTLIATSTL